MCRRRHERYISKNHSLDTDSVFATSIKVNYIYIYIYIMKKAIIRQLTDYFNYSQIYRLDYVHTCLVTYRQLLKSSERLFKMFLFRPFKINCFSSRHRLHLLWPGLHGGIFLMIPHLILCLLSLMCQIYLESSVAF